MDVCSYCLSKYYESKFHPGTCANCGAPGGAIEVDDALSKMLQRLREENRKPTYLFGVIDDEIKKRNREFIDNPPKNICPSLKASIKVYKKTHKKSDMLFALDFI